MGFVVGPRKPKQHHPVTNARRAEVMKPLMAGDVFGVPKTPWLFSCI